MTDGVKVGRVLDDMLTDLMVCAALPRSHREFRMEDYAHLPEEVLMALEVRVCVFVGMNSYVCFVCGRMMKE